ncbi:MAG: aldehyde dehydrogenase, partial [Proteobacteria bacterium]|nr:aldehyde dehydrogenase [Pseudomonadota bacterium]
MAVRIGINGFGRIGRLVLRAIMEYKRNDVEVVAINDLGSAEMNAHLLKYDSIHGTLPSEIIVDGDIMDAGAGPMKVTAERDPASLPWKEMGIDVALECTGLFNDRESASKHLDAGAAKVLISAPAKEVDLTVVYGVNHDKLEAHHTVVSNASCTTNCLAPVADVLNKAIGIERGFMTTIHAYTGDQRPLDTLHSDHRRARACGI